MRSRSKTMAAAALTIFMLSGLSLCAQQVVKSPSGDGQGESSTLTMVADPGASQPTASMDATAPNADGSYRYVPRVEWFLGYSYVRAVPTLAEGNRVMWLNGGSTSVAFNVNRYLGLVGDFGAYTNSKIDFQGRYPSSTVDVDNPDVGAFSYLFGPRISFRKSERVIPFLQVLAGGVRANQVALAHCSSNCTLLPAQTSFAMTAGGGLDVAIHRHFALRIVQAEYLMTRFASYTTGDSGTQNDIRLSSGIVFRFGGAGPQVLAISGPPTAACSIDKNVVYAGSGDLVGVHVSATDPQNLPLTYTWAANGGAVTGTGADAQWDSAGVAPGTYTVSLQAADDRGGSANCSVDVKVEAPIVPPLSLSCSADQTSVIAGDTVHVTATPGSANIEPLTYSWSASGGQIVGSGATVELDTTGLTTGTYTVTTQAMGANGRSAGCSVNIDARTLTPLEQKLALHSIYFPTNQPTVENPSGGLVDSQKAILVSLASDFKTYLEANPAAKLLLKGHSDPRASEEYNQALSQRRVDSARKFLIEHGIPAEDIQTKAFGEEQNLSDDQIKAEIAASTELTPEQRQKILDHLTTIILASNRRVDIMLTTTGQKSLRQYPFNALDSLTLLQQDAPR